MNDVVEKVETTRGYAIGTNEGLWFNGQSGNEGYLGISKSSAAVFSDREIVGAIQGLLSRSASRYYTFRIVPATVSTTRTVTEQRTVTIHD